MQLHIIFGEIIHCVIIEGDAYLVCRLGEESEYKAHIHAYAVRFGHKVSLFRQKELVDYYPLPVIAAGDHGDVKHISIRHYVALS